MYCFCTTYGGFTVSNNFEILEHAIQKIIGIDFIFSEHIIINCSKKKKSKEERKKKSH